MEIWDFGLWILDFWGDNMAILHRFKTAKGETSLALTCLFDVTTESYFCAGQM